jgi:hypothetical protein
MMYFAGSVADVLHVRESEIHVAIDNVNVRLRPLDIRRENADALTASLVDESRNLLSLLVVVHVRTAAM